MALARVQCGSARSWTRCELYSVCSASGGNRRELAPPQSTVIRLIVGDCAQSISDHTNAAGLLGLDHFWQALINENWHR